MAKRRTRQEKIAAKLRHELEKVKSTSPVEINTIKFEAKEKSVTKVDFYQPELSLPMNLLQGDLTRTAIVTILALVLQMATFFYLNHGGWQIINRIVERR